MAKSRPSSASAITKEGAKHISVHEFTEAVFSGVLRAVDARKPKLPGKIIYGIILDHTALRAEEIAGRLGGR